MPPVPDSQSYQKVWVSQPRTIGFLYNNMSRASPKAFPTPFSHTSAKDSRNDMGRMSVMLNVLGYETISQAIMMMNIDPRLRFRKAFSLSRFKVGDTGRHRFEFFNDPGSADELASTMIFLGYFKDSNEAVDFIDGSWIGGRRPVAAVCPLNVLSNSLVPKVIGGWSSASRRWMSWNRSK